MQKFKGLCIFFFLISIFISKTSLSQSAVAISLNEYQVTNTTGALDNYSELNDWVEIYNNFTGTVSLSGYWLSNDRTQLKKWPFPSTFTMNPGQYSIVWMSDRNETKIINGLHWMHTNFHIDQCKNQWIILTAPNGVVRDSIFVQRTQENHSRGRLNGVNADFTTVGVQGWRVYTAPTFSAINNQQPYLDYCKNPVFTEPAGIGSITSPTFEIYNLWAGVPIDTSCYQVWFTTDGSYPFPNYTNPWGPSPNTSIQYIDGMTPLIAPPTTMMMFRAATWPVSTYSISVNTPTPATWCETNFLPSFCETNTYFCEPGVLDPDFSSKFGVLSIADDHDSPPTSYPSWFQVGTPAQTVHAEYFEMQSSGVKRFVTEGYAQMTKPVNESWLAFQKGFSLNIDDRRGFGCNFESQIFNVPELGTSSRTVFPTLEVYGGDLEAHSTIASFTASGLSCGTGLRDVFLQTLAARYNLNVNPLHIKPISVFVNAKYMGTFNFKEVFDPYYEEYYNQQTQKDQTTMLFYHNGEGFVQTNTLTNNWRGSPTTDLYNFAATYPFNTVPNQTSAYFNTLKTRMDVPNFIDWNILNSYSQNSNLYNYNLAMAKGSNMATNGGKWHHYLWNMPSVFQFTCVTENSLIYQNAISSPCAISQSTYPLSPNRYNGQGTIFYNLMNKNGGNAEFRLDYITRYQDLLNGALSCDKILKHWDDMNTVYRTEYKKHEDPSTIPSPGVFVTATDVWDTNMAVLKRALNARCNFMATAFNQQVQCYGLIGPHNITVDVKPAGSGTVKLNTAVLPNYIWSGNYFAGNIGFKAKPIDTTFVFDHWEVAVSPVLNGRPLSLDSISIAFSAPDQIVAVFTDKKLDSALPSAFTPNGDGRNDVFGILGSGKYSTEFEMGIWNRWGQEVYRSTDPTAGWDGNFNGSQAQTGVYAYYITYKNTFNETKILKGNVTLLR